MHVYLETDRGLLEVTSSLNNAKHLHLGSLDRLTDMDGLKVKYGNLTIDEVRRTYDNNMYLLISGSFILAIEYILNSIYKLSSQEFRIIEDLTGLNKEEFEEFKELEIVEFPAT